MREFLRRHWVAVGERHGIVTTDGKTVGHVLDDLVAMTPDVIRTMREKLPDDFQGLVAEPILTGLQAAADKLAG